MADITLTAEEIGGLRERAATWKALAKLLFRCRAVLLSVNCNLSDQAERIRELEESDAYLRQETAAVRRVLLADVNDRDRKIAKLEAELAQLKQLPAGVKRLADFLAASAGHSDFSLAWVETQLRNLLTGGSHG